MLNSVKTYFLARGYHAEIVSAGKRRGATVRALVRGEWVTVRSVSEARALIGA